MLRLTGVMVRFPSGNLDIGDPRVPDHELLDWLQHNGLNAYGIRLIGIWLRRPTLRTFGLQ